MGATNKTAKFDTIEVNNIKIREEGTIEFEVEEWNVTRINSRGLFMHTRAPKGITGSYIQDLQVGIVRNDDGHDYKGYSLGVLVREDDYSTIIEGEGVDTKKQQTR